MLGSLTDVQIEELLQTEAVGRLGCWEPGYTYVVPTSYAYDGTAIYGHSLNGQKIRMMRTHPGVCFEVDHVNGVMDWQSVIVRGTYEELQGQEAMRALGLLMERFAPLLGLDPHAQPPAHGASPPHGATPANGGAGGGIGIVYRVRIEEKSGRFEYPG